MEKKQGTGNCDVCDHISRAEKRSSPLFLVLIFQGEWEIVHTWNPKMLQGLSVLAVR